MNTRIRLLLIAIGGVIVVAVFTFPRWRPIVVDDVVDEAFPGLAPEMQEEFLGLPTEEQAAFLQMVEINPTMAVEMVEAALSEDAEVPEEEQAMPEMTDPVIASAGSFIQIDTIHGAQGTATIYQLPDNTQVLRFEDFRSTNGPDLHVVLSVAQDPRSHEELGENFVDLGRLKGNVGNQNYDIPEDVDLSLYQSVVIYCLPYQVVFSTATLTLP